MDETTQERVLELIETMDQQDEKEYIGALLPTVESWVTTNQKDFFFSFRCIDTISSGLYSMIYSDHSGYGLSKMDYKSDDYFMLPSLPHKQILSDLETFWANKQRFIKYGLTPKRGVILHGHPGCGKSSLIYLLVEELKKHNGIAIYFDNPNYWIEIAKLVRKVEKTRPIVCIIEDLDLIINRYGEQVFLNFLDGLNSIDNVVYVATTNNLQDIPDRIKNRPSRFDKLYEVKKPNDEDRKLYFDNKLIDEDIKKYNLKKLVKDTKDFTMAHLKEVFVSLYILGTPYKETIDRLRGTNIADKTIGFRAGDDDDDDFDGDED